MIAELEYPALQKTWRAKLLKEAQARANSAAKDRRVFRESIERATADGHPDPEAFAANRMMNERLIDLHEKRVSDIFKRAEVTSRRRFDRAKAKHEEASKTAQPTKRRLPQRDRQYVEIIGEAEKGGYLADAALVLQKIETKLRTYRLPHWEKTTISLKVMAMSSECSKEGAQTINLRPNSTVCAKALVSPRGPASYMQDAIKRTFDKTFGKGKGPDFWFVIEMDTATKFHLHGAVVTPNVTGSVDKVDAALRAAGGKWESAGGHHHQQVTKSLDDPMWWAFYVVKRMNIANRTISTKLFASTRGLRSRAEAHWDDLRASLPQTTSRAAR